MYKRVTRVRTNTSSKAAVSLQTVYQRLKEFEDLEENWDSYGARRISAPAMDAAKRLAGTVVREFGGLVRERAVPYAVLPIPHGGVDVEWRGEVAELQVWVNPEGGMCYLLVERTAEGDAFKEAEDVSVADVLEVLGRVLKLDASES